MSRLRNRDPIENWIWEWGHDMDQWTQVQCTLPFDFQMYFPDIQPVYDWLRDDGFREAYFVKPNGVSDNGRHCQIIFLFENPKAAFPFKLRWG